MAILFLAKKNDKKLLDCLIDTERWTYLKICPNNLFQKAKK